MKLEHAVVQDLYPLYIENDLSPSVKIAVDEHLEKCEACKKFYETGEKTIQLKDMEGPAVSKALDDKIIFKMKLNRLRLISFVLAGILFSIVFTDYINEREQLFMATDGYYDVLGQMDRVIDVVKNKEAINFTYEMDRFHEYNNKLTNHMNFIEEYNKKSTEFHLFLNTQRLNAMLEVMNTRFNQGRWSETDESAYQVLKEYIQSHRQDFKEDYEKTHHGYSSYLHILDVKEMDKFYVKVNLLTYSYTRFHKMPDQIKPLNVAELKNRIAEALDIDKEDIELEKESPINNIYGYRFDIGSNGFGGDIDAATGQITNYLGDTGPLNDGPIMNAEVAMKKARFYLEKIYGKEVNLELISLGFNFNSSSNDSRYKVYSFKAVPKVEGYTLYTPLEGETMLNLNARSGKLESFYHNREIPSFDELDQADLSASPDQTGGKQAVVIYSALTGNFELVYIAPDLEYFEEGKFTSVKTGKEEQVYVEFH